MDSNASVAIALGLCFLLLVSGATAMIKSRRAVGLRLAFLCLSATAFWLWFMRHAVCAATAGSGLSRWVRPEILVLAGLPICLLSAMVAALTQMRAAGRGSGGSFVVRALGLVAYSGLALFAIGAVWLMIRGR